MSGSFEQIVFTRRSMLAASIAAPVAHAAHGQTPAHHVAGVSGSEGLVAVPGGNLFYWDTGGDGEPIVFVHPATGSAHSWRNQRDFFHACGYRAIGYSRWGYFGSDPAPGDDRKEYQDLVAMLDALQITCSHLVGVAGGASVVASVVGEHPARARSAALFCSVTGIGDESIQTIYKRIRPDNFHDMSTEFRELSPDYRAADPAGVAEWLTIDAQRPASAVSRYSQTTVGKLAASGIPLLFSSGASDQYAPPYLMRMVASQLPNARYRTIKEAAHAPFWEQPGTFNALLLEFIRSA